MPKFADLEVAVRLREAQTYTVEFRYNPAEGDADLRPGPGTAILDAAGLRAMELDADAYGAALTQAFFQDKAVAGGLAQARSATAGQDAMLRLRLFLDASASDLHAVHWETLRDPAQGGPLFTGDQVVFSRYLSSLDWRPVRLRPQADLSALVVIANPAGLEQYGLAKVDVDGELRRAKAAMDKIAVKSLASGGAATLNKITAELRNGYDILYLVCHGALFDGKAQLWLENDQGGVARTPGSDLVQRIKDIDQRPRLMVLASCQSAGGDDSSSSDSGALSALGPQLAEAGIPAVVAMQGNVSMKTVAQFMPVFFTELLRDGQIDRAAAVARGAVRERPDYWAAVLFMRLRSGRIWYVPGFGDDPKGFQKWPSIQRYTQSGKCTPIIGGGVVEGLFGSMRTIAQHWAETFHFPMQPYNRDDLPSVAQYLAVDQSSTAFPRDTLLDYLGRALVERHGDGMPADFKDKTLEQKMTAVGAKLRATDPAEPHRALASKPFPLYITTNPDDLLEQALVEAGRDPKSDFCRWSSGLLDYEGFPSFLNSHPDYRPDPQHPLVYHLFGRLSETDSLVLTEDDYFDYLIGATANKDTIPGFVRRALADSLLLFLGFHVEEWKFRVLFRSIISQEGGAWRSKYPHVAAQIDPEEGRILEPDRARKYLESYFKDSSVSIFWGGVADFVAEWVKRTAGAAAA